MITKVIEIEAKPACEKLLYNLLSGLVEPSRAEQGCERYDLFEDVNQSGRFIVFESWATDDELEAHRHSEHMADFKEKAPDLIAHKAGYSI